MAAAMIPWREVTPLQPLNGAIPSLLATVDSLKAAWEESIRRGTPEEFAGARLRTLRRHAIETGIIERLYDADWGVTEALVAEGLTLEVAEREAGITPGALDIIRSQFEALEFLASLAREGRDLSIQIVRELHAAITRHQMTYEATDLLGQKVQATLHHGEWKKWPNHVVRQDGSVFEYAPPEQVQQQMEHLVEVCKSMQTEHPVVRAAWLHHSFICIHPFEDGNGRVGRALVLLVLLRANYAPLVVDRTRRSAYLKALDAANDGDLSPLVRLFAELEIVALRSELERPLEPSYAAGAVGVAKAYANRLRERRLAEDKERKAKAEQLAAAMHERLQKHLESVGEELRRTFRAVDTNARAPVTAASPPDERATWWKVQLIRSAREVGFRANLADGTWWVRLHVVVLGQTLRYVVAIQRVGYEDNGVLAVTVFAEMLPSKETAETGPVYPTPALPLTTADSVTLVTGNSPDARWPDVEELVERTLAAAVDSFGSQLG